MFVYLYTTNAVMPHPQHRTGANADRQTPLSSLHGPSLDLRSLADHCVLPLEVDIRRRHVVKRFVIPLVVVVRDEVPQRLFQLPREVVVLELHHVLHRPVVACDLPLRLWVILLV